MKDLFEVTPEQAAEWRERERVRMTDGTYTPLPDTWRYSYWFCGDTTKMVDYPDGQRWYPPRYPDHFAHVSVDKVAMIAFTESDQKGVRDRQTRINPGKYLARFFSEWLTPSDIQHLATQMGADYNDDATLHFAKTADEIEHVYCNGPTSCMDGRHSFDSPVHPTRVYAGFDLNLAYLKREGKITARALCWPEKLVYGRVYGDQTRLTTMMGRLGYKDGSLSGARITKLMHNDAYVIPYLDNLDGAVDKGDHLMLSDDGCSGCDCGSDNQNGLSKERYQCEDCGDHMHPEDAYVDGDGGHYCRDCWTENRWQCDLSGEWIHSDDESPTQVRVSSRRRDGRTVYYTQDWCEYSVNSNAFFCDRDEVYYDANSYSSTDVGGETWGPEAVERDAACCVATDTWYQKDETVELYDGRVWCQEHFDEFGTEIDGKRYESADLPKEDGLTDAQWLALYAEAEREDGLCYDRRIVVGCLVTCTGSGGGYHAGGVYKVKSLYHTKNGSLTVLTERDDHGSTMNGWGIKYFRFHSMPAQTGLHIRHEPERVVFTYRVYDGDRHIDGWGTRDSAERHIARLQEERERAERQQYVLYNPPAVDWLSPMLPAEASWTVQVATAEYDLRTDILTTRNT